MVHYSVVCQPRFFGNLIIGKVLHAAHLKDAPRPSLSQIRNRLLELKGAPPASQFMPATVVTAGVDVQKDQIVTETAVHQ